MRENHHNAIIFSTYMICEVTDSIHDIMDIWRIFTIRIAGSGSRGREIINPSGGDLMDIWRVSGPYPSDERVVTRMSERAKNIFTNQFDKFHLIKLINWKLW